MQFSADSTLYDASTTIPEPPSPGFGSRESGLMLAGLLAIKPTAMSLPARLVSERGIVAHDNVYALGALMTILSTPTRSRDGCRRTCQRLGAAAGGFRWRFEAPYLHESLIKACRAIMATGEDDCSFLFKHRCADCVGGLSQFADQVSLRQVPDFYPPIGSARYYPRVVELQRCHAVIVCCQAVDRCVCLKRPNADGAVGSACHKGIAAELELAYEGGVAL